MKKVPNPMSNLPKEIANYIKQQEKLEKEIRKAKRSCFGFDKGGEQQEMDRLRINKELSIANRMINKQKKETERLKYNLRNFLL